MTSTDTWDARPSAKDRSTDTACDVHYRFYLRNLAGELIGDEPSMIRCEQPRVATWWIGCTHEHLAPTDICADHAAELEGSPISCQRCLDAGDPKPSHVLRIDPAPEIQAAAQDGGLAG